MQSSLALVNRELTSRLLRDGFEVECVDTIKSPSSGLVRTPSSDRPADVVIRHQWPPDFQRPASERLIIFQHWEFGSLPRTWVSEINHHVDEFWVAATSVLEHARRSGVSEQKLRLVPLGVDSRKFHPGVRAMPLPTTKSFRFLFVGGTIPRKGINELLEAYGRTFSALDDVTLIVKDFGGSTFYRGQIADRLIQQFKERKRGPELLYIDRELDDVQMPSLYSACHALVHPYRGEGFGLTIAEAMSMGLPTIVTGRGAAMDFCDDRTSYLIPAQEVALPFSRIGELETVEHPTYMEPSVHALCKILRRVVGERGEASARGHLARERVRATLSWEHTIEVVEEALTNPGATLGAKPERSLDEKPQGHGAISAVDSSASPGIVWAAAPFGYSGYSRISRAALPELARSRIPAQLISLSSDPRFVAQLNQDAGQVAFWNGLLSHQVNGGVLVLVHPPVSWNGISLIRNSIRRDPSRSGTAIFTMFETDRLPTGWVNALLEVDEVWVPSRFNMETFERSGVPRDRLRLVQPGLEVHWFKNPTSQFQIPGRRGFVFLSVFQWTLRKGWDALLDAWMKAFDSNDDVCLVLRTYPGTVKEPRIEVRIEDYLRSKGRNLGNVAPIIVLSDFIDDAGMPSLYAAANAYVLPSRGEAWGLPYMEAMAMGLPTIACDHGGQLDFMHQENSYLTRIRGLVPVDPRQTAEDPYYGKDHLWADPDVEHLADVLRFVSTNQEEARAKGQRAKAEILQGWRASRAVPSILEGISAMERKPRSERAIPTGGSGEDSPQVRWTGPLEDPSGYAEEGRHLVLGLDAIGIDLTTDSLAWSRRKACPPRRDAARLESLRTRPLHRHRVAVWHGFPPHFRQDHKAIANIGRTMFETDRVPPEWVAACNAMDEIWVPSEWNLKTFARSGVASSRLWKVGSPLDASHYAAKPPPFPFRSDRRFHWLSVFDFTLRKGWDVLLRAWAKAFNAESDVTLHLKTWSSIGLSADAISKCVEKFIHEQLRCEPEDLAPIEILEDDLSSEEMMSLYASADGFVLASRGEGWGRPLMESMAFGVPTVGPASGGSTEFMDEQTSFLIDVKETQVPDAAVREAPTFRGHRWFEPSVDHLAEIFREVTSNHALAKKRADKGREHVLARYDRKVIGSQMREHIQKLSIAMVL